MSKYLFESNQIKDCLDCPCIVSDRSDWDMYCGLSNSRKITSNTIPDWCKLSKQPETTGQISEGVWNK